MSALSDCPALASVAAPRPGLLALLREDVACVFARDPAARNRLEVLTIYPGVHALAAHRVAHALWRRGLRYPARLLSHLARMFTQADIHPGAKIGRRFFIDHGCGVVIGETAEIGDDVTLYHGVTLGGTSWHPGKRHPTLGSGVVVGAGAKILGAITLGDNARVAANSVVIEDVAAGMTVVGIPGRTVLPKNRRRITAQGIDLDHHLMPDPVGKAIACLLDRIAELERQLAGAGADTPAASCQGCAPDEFCAQPVTAGPLTVAPLARRAAQPAGDKS
ncbi:serine O-acetyltransferase [Aromatoleum toluvorans]|uniref:serine O-acetyltransferase n=1 Tax=Aromatoleum toluvorans TaxID=92002 RepID=A0ABX1Q4B2_9RHOO|nr:serine O-acetyltransferase [Aromatoleum toluvorans]NMG46255.1 serine O-acetyltransferase [Aromatoleum toluvorans]